MLSRIASVWAARFGGEKRGSGLVWRENQSQSSREALQHLTLRRLSALYGPAAAVTFYIAF